MADDYIPWWVPADHTLRTGHLMPLVPPVDLTSETTAEAEQSRLAAKAEAERLRVEQVARDEIARIARIETERQAAILAASTPKPPSAEAAPEPVVEAIPPEVAPEAT